jgi:hypothetical protein
MALRPAGQSSISWTDDKHPQVRGLLIARRRIAGICVLTTRCIGMGNVFGYFRETSRACDREAGSGGGGGGARPSALVHMEAMEKFRTEGARKS